MTDTNTAQLVVDLQATDDAVRANGWVAPGLGMPGSPLGLLGSTLNPLVGLAEAGLGWFTSFVSFLGEPLSQLQGGDAGSVSSGAHDFGAAGSDIAGVASDYRASTSGQTSGWSGAAASDYRGAAAQHADGVAGLGQASTTVGSAIIGAGQVVAQAIAEITELIAEAVSQIVPIMSQAIARAPETFGQSVAEAIPPCVGIAIEYALRCLAKLAALLASGDNLMKLVQGGLAVVDLIKQALSGISQRSIRPDADPTPGTGSGQPPAGPPTSVAEAIDAGNSLGAQDSGNSGAPSGTSSRSAPAGLGGAPTIPGSPSIPRGTAIPSPTPLGIATHSTAATPPSPTTLPHPTPTGGAAAPPTPATTGFPVNAAGLGLAAGARTAAGRGADSPHHNRTQQSPPAASPPTTPMGGLPGARPTPEKDKEHQRKYTIVDHHDEPIEVAPAVITARKPQAPNSPGGTHSG